MSNGTWSEKQINCIIKSIEKEKHIEISKRSQLEAISAATGASEAEVKSHAQAAIKTRQSPRLKRLIPVLAKVLFIGAAIGVLVNFSGEGRKTSLAFLAGGAACWVLSGNEDDELELGDKSLARGRSMTNLKEGLANNKLTDEDKLLVYAAAASQIPLTRAHLLYSCPLGYSEVWKDLNAGHKRSILIKNNEIHWKWD